MVKLSNSDDNSSSYSKPHQFGFSALLKEHQIQKDKFPNDTNGYGVKLILDYNKEVVKFNEITLNGYQLISKKFEAICNEFNKSPDNQLAKIHIPIQKTGVNDQTFTNIINETIENEPTEHIKKQRIKKVKKRTIDEQTADTTVANNDTEQLNQTTKTKKKKKLKAKRISKTKEDNKLDTTAELVAKNLLNQSIKSEKLSILVTNNINIVEIKTNPTKKVRLTLDNSMNGQLRKSIKTKVKKTRKSSKKKSSVLSKKTSMQSTSNITLGDCLTSTRFEFNEQKTPSRNTNRLNSIMESNTKTIKAEKRIPSVHASGKVKQMVELVEARMKTSMQNTPNTVVKPTQQKPQYSQSIQVKKANPSSIQTLAAVAKKLRSSIDERKKRISISKVESKRQSTKRINAFLNDISQQMSTVTKPLIAPVSTVKKKLNYPQAKIEIKEEPVEHPEEIQSNNQDNKPKRPGLSNIISSSSTIQQHYRLKQTSSMNSERKNSFHKFLERNTPCKFNKNEIDEKRKQELMKKEENEQKRLQEREKLLLEKIETAKKKREEKMKRIVEVKTQQQEDNIKRKEEIEAKQKEAEENKKRQLEEKRKEEFEKQRIKEQHRVVGTLSVAHSNSNNNLNHASANVMGSAHKLKPFVKPNFTSMTPSKNDFSKPMAPLENKTNDMGFKSKLPFNTKMTNELCKTPSAINNKIFKTNSKGTPIPSKKKTYENYDICDLKSGDETDDDEEPSKPIPEWAKEPNLSKRTVNQFCSGINYTQLFKASSQNEIILENIFKIKRKKFTERGSSAIWNSPPVWRTGLNGDESFRQLHQL